jgi:hypothetical protein
MGKQKEKLMSEIEKPRHADEISQESLVAKRNCRCKHAEMVFSGSLFLTFAPLFVIAFFGLPKDMCVVVAAYAVPLNFFAVLRTTDCF